jgi:hypothetical protein
VNYPPLRRFLYLNTEQYAQVLYDLMGEEGVPDARALTKLSLSCVRWTRTGEGPNPVGDLTDYWYATGNYDVYDDDRYLADTFSCWIIYSRQYLRMLLTLPLPGVHTVADVGCGIGFSTVGLGSVFPDATIYGTNLPNTTQTRIAQRLGNNYDFDIYPALQEADLVFASEYFEHFPEPLEELATVLRHRPRYLVVASTYTQPSIGHFDHYRCDGKDLAGRQTGRAFNKAMRGHGYRRLTTGFWNNRPAVWEDLMDTADLKDTQ